MGTYVIAHWSLICLTWTCMCLFVSTARNTSLELQQQQGSPLKVCDCESATGGPNNLSCDKEGYFLIGYTNHGRYLNKDGPAVPLGPGYCCRSCVPNNVDSQPGVSIVWEGCQQAGSQVACTGYTPLFLTGFTLDHATINQSPSDRLYYPLSPAVCCRPGVLMKDGQMWEIKQCNCRQREDVLCNATAGEFLTGFQGSEFNGEGTLPLAPVECCQMCLGSKIIDVADCSFHNHCSAHGDCILGSCVCNEGWSGASCDYQSGSNDSDGGISLGLLPVLIIACAMASICMFTCIKRAITCTRQWVLDRSQAIEQSQQSNIQLQQVPTEGSVGSVDTQSLLQNEQDNFTHTVTTRFPLVPQFLQAILNNRNQSPLTTLLLSQQQQYSEAEDDSISFQSRNEVEEEQQVCDRINFATEANCALCFERPVQVALVPCGHSNLCRKCSRKLQQCPFCRKPIARRQRLFFTN